jgi:Cys-tRNA(Pro)/Cys-tRNA(Cys) deacylase
MTPAINAAEAAQIAFVLHPYEHSANAESFGHEAAEKLGVAPERMFKTLVAKVDGRHLVMVLVPVAARLDVKKLAAVVGGKRAELADPNEAQRATGYVIGGISPLGGRKKLPTFLDESVLGQATVFVSAGQRGLQMELSPHDLVRLTAGRTAALTAQV